MTVVLVMNIDIKFIVQYYKFNASSIDTFDLLTAY